MQSEKPKLVVHTTLTPPQPETKAEIPTEPISWTVLPKKPQRLRLIQGKARKEGTEDVRQRRVLTRSAPRIRGEAKKLTAGEKLMRNTAIACALLLTMLALRNVDQPWTQQAAEGLRRAMTTQIDLDESLGRLSFVREMVPDTALVFWNMGATSRVMQPVAGEVSHEFEEKQPWIEYRCAGSQAVYAVDAGMVVAVTQSESGDFSVLIDHDGGAQSVYAFMKESSVKAGQRVALGEQLGSTQDAEESRLYFEYRIHGVPKDPRGLAAS